MRLLPRIQMVFVGALVLALPGLMPGDAGAQTWTGTQQSVDDLRYRLSIIDAELASIRAQVGQMDPGTGAAPAGGGAGSGGASQFEIDRLTAELQRLTGQVEQMNFRLEQIAEDATRRFGDIEFRLTELEGGDIAALGTPQPLGGQTSSPGLSADPGASNNITGPALAGADAQVSISERDDLQRAVKDIEQGRFDQGEDRLRRFLNSYPNSPLQGEALYWLAESQFVRGQLQDAARSYLNGYNADRKGPAAARNLMRLGVTLGKLGQQAEACLTLREVARQFPNAPAEVSSQAAEEAASLSCG